MSEIIRCDSCRGLKRIVGLGMIEKDCPECRGVGFVELMPVEVITDDAETVQDVITDEKPEDLGTSKGKPTKAVKRAKKTK
jgi:phage FluMu protein Com